MLELPPPLRVRCTDQQSGREAALDVAEAIEAIVEGALVQKQGRTLASGAVSAERPQATVEQRLCHPSACAPRRSARQAPPWSCVSWPRDWRNR